MADPTLPTLHSLRPADPGSEDAVFFASPRVGERFANPWGATRPATREVFRWKTQRNPHRAVKRRPPALPVVEGAVDAFAATQAPLKVLWPGHATALVEVAGSDGAPTRVLIDPIFGRAGGVIPRVTACPVTSEQLPEVHVVAVTHGHHDHLDARSLRAVAQRFPEALFVVPAGLAAALPAACRRVLSFDWWDRAAVAPGVELIFVPAQHWHRRGLLDENSALWGGWVVRGAGGTVYHSGDTGAFGGFATIGRVVGPLDVAILPLGAYEPEWFMHSQHMPPAGSLAAFEALGARHFLGMHWGTFDLSDEPVNAGPAWLHGQVAERGLDAARFHVAWHGATLACRGAEAQLTHAHKASAG